MTPPLETLHRVLLLCQHKTGCRPSYEKLRLRLRLNLFGFKFFQKQQRLFPFAPSFANRHMVESQNDNSLTATGAICLPFFHCQEQGDLTEYGSAAIVHNNCSMYATMHVLSRISFVHHAQKIQIHCKTKSQIRTTSP